MYHQVTETLPENDGSRNKNNWCMSLLMKPFGWKN
jgi:hypothetical protein